MSPTAAARRAALAPILAATLALATPAPAAAEGGDAQALRATVLDAALRDDARTRAARSLEDADPEGLGTAFLELAKKKDPHNLAFLVDAATRGEVRHLRVTAVWAAWQCAPDGALAAFVALFGHEDEKVALRAIEAAGFLAVPTKDREIAGRLLEVARTATPLRAIEAVRALSRMTDKRLLDDLADLCATTPDDHVRKHAVWALVDQVGERNTEKRLAPLKGRAGDAGRRANEAIEILKDKEEEPFTWNPAALTTIPAWWAARTKGLKLDVAIGDDDSRKKVEGFIEHLGSIGPSWRHLVLSTFSKIQFRPQSEHRILDPKTRTLFINAGEVVQCETDWQGAYIIARTASLGFAAALGEPIGAHRGWESSYVEMHTFFLTDGQHKPGPLAEFVAAQTARKGWR